MTNKKKHEMCPHCKVRQTLKSGWGFKSPPQDQLKKKRFRRRWLTLSIVEVCVLHWMEDLAGGHRHGDGSEEDHGRQWLVLSYFKDDTENSLKGRFYIDKNAVNKVKHITEDCPSKYKENPFILRFDLQRHSKRILYLILENENERDLWMKAYESYFQMLEQQANKQEDDFAEKEIEKFKPETNKKLQREIAASKRDRNYQPSLNLVSSLEDHDEETTEHGDTTTSRPLLSSSTTTTPLRISRSSRISKRSGGSFSHNDERESFEKEDEDSDTDDNDVVDGGERSTSSTPKGYSYLPPVKGASIKQKRTARGSSSNDSTDETDGKGSYTFMTAPRNIPATTPEGDESYCFMPKPKNTPVKDKQSKINGSEHVQEAPSSPTVGDENYCFMPKPKNTSLETKDPQSKINPTSAPVETEEDHVPNENYCFLPPPKPLPSSPDKKTASRMNSQERIVSDRQSIKQRVPITPIKKLCQQNDDVSAERSGDEVDAPNYHFLPPPKPTSLETKQPPTTNPDSSDNGYTYLPPKSNPQQQQEQQLDDDSLSFPTTTDQLNSNKHMNRPSNRYAGNTNNINNNTSKNSDKIDENYINFAPIQQMKMIAKNNIKPITVAKTPNDPNNYMNFKY